MILIMPLGAFLLILFVIGLIKDREFRILFLCLMGYCFVGACVLTWVGLDIIFEYPGQTFLAVFVPTFLAIKAMCWWVGKAKIP